MLFKKFEDRIVMDDIIKKNVELGNWEQVISHIQSEIFDKPEEYFNLGKIRVKQLRLTERFQFVKW